MSTDKQDKQMARWGRMARVMDELFRIPGTQLHIGLDPILGLFPGVGDAIAGAISSTLLLQANKENLPKIIQFRMALNIFLNTVLGAIPGFGDLFSLWFKSNVRNYELYQKHHIPEGTYETPTSTKGSWLFVLSLFIGMIVLVLGSFFLIFGLFRWIFGS